MLLKTMKSSETVQVFVRCHIVRPDEFWPDGYVMRCVFQWARDTTMAPAPGRPGETMGASLARRRLAAGRAAARRWAAQRTREWMKRRVTSNATLSHQGDSTHGEG